MNKTAKRLLIFLGSVLGLILLILFMVAVVFEKQVGNLVIKELNQQLETELTVEDFDLTLISSFPNANIVLNEVALPGVGDSESLILEAEKVSLKFGVASLLSKQYKIKSIRVDNGASVIYIDKSGAANYEVFKSDDSTPGSSFDIALEDARFNDIEVIYVDEQKKVEAYQHIETVGLSGLFSNEKFQLNTFSEIRSGFIETPEGRYLVNKQLAYDAELDVDLTQGLYEFKDVKLVVDANRFQVTGAITNAKDYTDYNLNLIGEKGSVASVVSLFPQAFQKQLSDFDSNGAFFFEGIIDGKSSPTESPAISIDFGLKNGRISSPRLEYSLKDASFDAKFTNGNKRSNKTSSFEVSRFEGDLRGKPVAFSLKIEDIDNPVIDLNVTGEFSLAGIHGLFNNPTITDGGGSVFADSLHVVGEYKHMVDPRYVYKVKTSGKLFFQDAMLKVNNERITLKEGQLMVDNNNFTVEDIRLIGASNDILFNGTLNNLLPVMLSDSLNTKNAKLEFQGDLKAKEVDLDRLENLLYVPVDEGRMEEETLDSIASARIIKRERMFDMLDGAFGFEIDFLNYNEIEGRNFLGNMTFSGGKLLLKDFTIDAMDGQLLMGGQVFFEEEPYMEMLVDCIDIDIKKFFNQTENFGQEMLTEKHVKGTLNSRWKIKAYWDKEGNLLMDKLYALGDATLTDGELIKFEMLDEFSSFVKVQDLRHVKFTELRNQFAIMDGAFYIPTMFIQSNALNLTVSGKQRFDDRMKYLIKVNAGQVLWNKMKKHNPDLKPKKAKKKGFINVRFAVEGTTDNYTFERSKKTYNQLLANLEGRFRLIRKEVADQLDVESVTEPEDWGDDPTDGE